VNRSTRRSTVRSGLPAARLVQPGHDDESGRRTSATRHRSHMVLQRDTPIPIWGSAEPGEAVTVKLGEHTAKTQADARGACK